MNLNDFEAVDQQIYLKKAMFLLHLNDYINNKDND